MLPESPQEQNLKRQQRIAEYEQREMIRKQKEQAIIEEAKKMWQSLNPAQKVGMSPIGFPFTDAIGLAGDVQMYKENPEMRSAGNYALSGVGLLPFVPSVASTVLKKAPNARLQRAKEMGFNTDKRVFHGTSTDNLDEFKDSYIGTTTDEGFFGKGHYFTSESGSASYYGPNVGEYYLKGKYLDLSPNPKNSNFELGDTKYFKFWTKELDKIDMLDEPTKKGLKTINKIDDYVDNNVKIIKADDAYGNEGVAAYVKDPSGSDKFDRIYSSFGLADKDTAIKNLKDQIINETSYNSNLRKIFPDLDNTLFSLSDYIRVGGKGSAELTRQAKKAGYDGIKVGDEYVAFDPKKIRSTSAKFDPSKAQSAGLLAGTGALAVGSRLLKEEDAN